MSDDRDGVPPSPDGTAVETLRTSREEARIVLDHQLDALADIHDKAMRTVRITLVVLGILLSATTFQATRQFVNALTVLGTASLVLSILTGLVTYSATDPQPGIGAEHLEDSLTATYSEKEWLAVLLVGYKEWIEDATELATSNARLLSMTQLLIGLGVSLVAAGVLLALFGVLDPVVSTSTQLPYLFQ